MEGQTSYRCGICLNSMEEPRALPCLHSFCTSCLRSLCEADLFRCPECRKTFTLPVGGVEEFPVNFYLKPASPRKPDTVAPSEITFLCSECQEAPIAALNLESGRVYCAKCSLTQGTGVVPLGEPESTLETFKCATHPEAVLNNYCFECHVLLCEQCQARDHAEHPQVDINKASNKIKSEIRTALNDGRRERLELLALMESMTLKGEQMKESKESVVCSVNETFAHVQKVLMLYKQCILREIDATYEKNVVLTEEGRKDVVNLVDKLDEMFLSASPILHGSSLTTLAQSHILHELKQVFVECDASRNNLLKIHNQEQDKSYFPSVSQLNAMTARIQTTCLDAILCPNQPFPPNCTLTQCVANPLIPGKEYTAVLTCYSGWMTPATVNQKQLTIQLSSEEGLEGTTLMEQKENTFAIKFSIPASGIYRLHVKIDGTDVEGSPVTLYGMKSCTGASKLSHMLYSLSGPARYTHVAVSRESDIAASNVTQGCIDLFDSRGLYVKSIKSDKIGSPGGLCFDPFGNIIVIDTERRCVRKFTRGGNYICKIGTYGAKNSQMIHPIDVATSLDGSIFIVDSARDRIFVYSEAGVLKKEIGGYGSGPLHFRMPTAIAFREDNTILVADNGNKRIQVLSSEGEFLYFFGKNDNDQGKLTNPYHISIASDGIVVVTEKESSSAMMFSDKGEFIHSGDFPNTPNGTSSNHTVPLSVVPTSRHELLVVSSLCSGIAVYC